MLLNVGNIAACLCILISFGITSTLTFALPAPAPVPAGGPQGTITYPMGTLLNAAVLQPSGNDFLVTRSGNSSCSNAHVVVEDHRVRKSAPHLTWRTSNSSSIDGAGYTALTVSGKGLTLNFDRNGQLVAQHTATDTGLGGWVAQGGRLINAAAPHGFFCESTMSVLGEH